MCFQDAGRGPNSYAPQPTSFPNHHHTVVGETPHSTVHSTVGTQYTLANTNLHQPLISFLYIIPSCKHDQISYGRIICLESQKIDGTYQRYNHYFKFF